MKNRETFRHAVLQDLSCEHSLLRMNEKHEFADDLRQSIMESPAFILDDSVTELTDSLASMLSKEEFFRSIPEARLPFERQWCEFKTRDNDPITFGGIVERVDDGIRVRLAMRTERAAKGRKGGVLHSEADILFKNDGDVVYSETPIESFFAIIEDYSDGNGYKGSDDIGTLDERKSDAFDFALRLAGTMAVLAKVMEKRGTVDVLPEAKIFPIDRKSVEKKGGSTLSRGVTRVKLGKLGKQHLATPELKGTSGKKRAAHWVRGHMFLARNGKLTYRRPHIRGLGEVKQSVRAVEAPAAEMDSFEM